MSITTKKGDQGQTRLYSGERVYKDCLQIECVGEVDELVSALGMAKAASTNGDMVRSISQIQQWLFIVGSDIATLELNGRKVRRVCNDMLDTLDCHRVKLEAHVGKITDFIVPGTNPESAALDMARSIARRLERHIVQNREMLANGDILMQWINRLSDYLFLLARSAEPNREYVSRN